MSLLIDQTWVREWPKRNATPVYREALVRWYLGLPAAFQDLAEKFPIHCLVCGDKNLDLPFPGTVGVVRAYQDTGNLLVSQHPDEEPVAVPSDRLELVTCWYGVTPDFLRACRVMKEIHDTTPPLRRRHLRGERALP